VALFLSLLLCCPGLRTAAARRRYQTAAEDFKRTVLGDKQGYMPGQLRKLRELIGLEMEHRHDWLSVVVVRSAPFSRGHKVVMAATVTLAVMCLPALCYELLLPKGRCATHHSKQACLGEIPLLSLSRGCVWLPPRQQCIPPELLPDDYLVTTIVAVVTSLISIPVNKCLTSCLASWLFAPVRSRPLSEILRIRRLQERASVSKGLGLRVRSQPSGHSSSSDEEGDGRERAVAKVAGEVDRPVPTTNLAVRSNIHDWQVARYERLLKREREVEIETLRSTQFAQANWKELSGYIRVMDVARDQLRTRMEQRALQDPDAIPRLMKQIAFLSDRGRKLEDFLRRLQRAWNLDQTGHPNPPSLWDKVTCTRHYLRLRQKIEEDLLLVDRLEATLHGVSRESRDRLLLEYQRLDFMSRAQRAVYLRYVLQDEAEYWYQRLLDRPSLATCAVGLVGTSLLALAMAAYLLRFASQQGRTTTVGWLISLVLAVLHEPVLNIPIAVLFFARCVPRAVQLGIETTLDVESNNPFQFQKFIATGPGSW
jgi:hypothetical protein